MTEYASILERLTVGEEHPEGTDHWALKATDFAGRTRHDFQWPDHGWVEAEGPFSSNAGPCPMHPGDGICVAFTYDALAAGGHRALALMLVAFGSDDVLGEARGKVRVRRAFVVHRLDGEQVIRTNGAGADLSRASLCGADLSRADLSRADLSEADLSGVDLGDWEGGEDGYAKRRST